ncbi:MAG: TROVE domain-containing protein [Caldilineaceae bacterium]
MNFTTYFSKQRTPQSIAIPGTNQVMNSAGGYAWAVDSWTRLDRFLVLGTEGGTYYTGEQQLTLENAQAVRACIAADGPRVVARIVEISAAGRAPKNDPALFALAMCAGLGDEATRKAALAALPQVARIGTHLFHFLAYVELFRGWGRAMRRAVADWYNVMPTERLAYQVIKYQQRDGWSHRDVASGPPAYGRCPAQCHLPLDHPGLAKCWRRAARG